MDWTLEAVTAVVVGVAGAALRMAVRFALSPEGRAIRRVLREAGARAALRARAAYVEEFRRAQAVDSAGGATVTPEERTALARAAWVAFRNELDVMGVLEKVADAFGGVEKLEAAMLKRIEDKLSAAARQK